MKQEDTSDKIALLKKVEIKFHELAEKRKVFDFFMASELAKREQEEKKALKNLKNEENKLRMEKEEE